MSIGIYAFLRIYFLGFGVSVFEQFRTHRASPPAPAPSRSTRRGLSGIECRPVQRVQRPGACAGARPVVGMVCAATCAVQSVRVRWGLGYTGGAYSRHPAPPGQSRHHRKNKKGSKITPPPIANLPNFPQKQKDPYKGSVFCAILALQALKGRSLQKCTPYLE